MSRAIPKRRSHGRASRTSAARPGARPAHPAYVEADDESPTGPTPTPAVEGRVIGADPPASVAPTTPSETAEASDPDLPVLSAATELSLQERRRPRGLVERHRRLVVAGWVAVTLAGLASLVCSMLGIGSAMLDDAGAVIVLGAYSWALAARTGGRAVVFGFVALVGGIAVLVSDQPYLRTGAAVMTCGISATLAVVATVPATGFLKVARECVIAVVIAAIGALATLGFAPTISLVRFEYATLALSLLGAFGVVFRLGAGFHGLGRRGVIAVVGGGGVLVVTLIYAEALRRYGPPGVVDGLLDAVRWARDHLGAFPRPVEAVLGIPALAWGVHMRARRRQGWWVCAFGAAGTATVANSLLNPAITFRECGLSVLYGLVVGLALGYAVIRVDLAVAGTGSGGRRSEDHAAARPEPPRTASLL